MKLASRNTAPDRPAEPPAEGDPAPARELRRPEPRRKQRVRVYTPVPRFAFRLRDIWRYRGLMRWFGKIYIEKRYRRTWLGWLWIPIRPAADVAGRVFLFGSLLGVSAGDRPYFMFFIVGVTAWRFFAAGVLWAARSLELNRTLISRVHLPRVSAVVASIVPAAIEAAIYGLIGVIGAVYFYLTQGSFFVTIGAATPAAVVGLGLLALYVVALGFWTAPLGYHARDVRFVLSYVIGFWFIATPVIYPISAIPEKFRPLAEYNPLTGPIELVKYGLLQTAPPSNGSLVVSLAVLGVLLVGGAIVFARSESRAATKV